MDPLSQIALTFTSGLGNSSIRRLVDLYPDEDIFSLPKSELKAAFGSHRDIADNILNKSGFARAEEELCFCEKNHIRPLFFTSPDYPTRLNRPETDDCPALLYLLGSTDLNPERSIAVVGTRRATSYGRDNTDRLVRELNPYHTPIVSGLAYGIDTAAHTAALNHNLPTVAVLGHGLDQIYPAQNRPLAKRISPPATESLPHSPTPPLSLKPLRKEEPSSLPPSPPATSAKSLPSPDASPTPTPAAPTISSPPTAPSLSATPTTSPSNSAGPSWVNKPRWPK